MLAYSAHNEVSIRNKIDLIWLNRQVDLLLACESNFTLMVSSGLKIL